MTPSEYIDEAGTIFVLAILFPIISGITSFLTSYLTQKINAIMKKNGKKPLFSNAHDYNVLGRDYVNLMKESNQSW